MQSSFLRQRQHRLLLLIAVAVILVCVGIAQTVARSSAKALLEVRDPLSTGHDLFNPEEFIRLRRESRSTHINEAIDQLRTPASSSESFETSSSASSELSSVVSSEAAAAMQPFTLQDLSPSAQQVLRNQLRSGGCPQEADVRYLALCKSLLDEQSHPAPQAGLANPDQ